MVRVAQFLGSGKKCGCLLVLLHVLILEVHWLLCVHLLSSQEVLDISSLLFLDDLVVLIRLIDLWLPLMVFVTIEFWIEFV